MTTDPNIDRQEAGRDEETGEEPNHG